MRFVSWVKDIFKWQTQDNKRPFSGAYKLEQGQTNFKTVERLRNLTGHLTFNTFSVDFRLPGCSWTISREARHHISLSKHTLAATFHSTRTSPHQLRILETRAVEEQAVLTLWGWPHHRPLCICIHSLVHSGDIWVLPLLVMVPNPD